MTAEVPTHVNERLTTETVIWLTTSKADGMPLPNPVWFLWRGGEFLVLTIPGSVKLKNMSLNPLASLNLNSTSVDGSDVAVFHVEGGDPQRRSEACQQRQHDEGRQEDDAPAWPEAGPRH